MTRAKRMAPLVQMIATYKERHAKTKPVSDAVARKRLRALAVELATLRANEIDGEDHYVYVYAYLDPRTKGRYEYTLPSGKVVRFKHEPFYIGKGKDLRSRAHLKASLLSKGGRNAFKITLINKLLKLDLEPIIVVTGSRASDVMAQALEIDLIAGIGRRNKDEGPLTNLTDGGDGNAGYKMSDASKAKVRAAKLGKKASPETRAKMSAAASGRVLTDEWRANMSAARIGKAATGQYAKGHTKSTEECAKNSAAQQRNNAVREALPDIKCNVCGHKGRLLLSHFTNCRGKKFKDVPDSRKRPDLPSVFCPHCNHECRGPSFIEHFGNCPHKR